MIGAGVIGVGVIGVAPGTQVGGLAVAAGDDEVGHVGRAVGRIVHPLIGRTRHRR